MNVKNFRVYGMLLSFFCLSYSIGQLAYYIITLSVPYPIFLSFLNGSMGMLVTALFFISLFTCLGTAFNLLHELKFTYERIRSFLWIIGISLSSTIFLMYIGGSYMSGYTEFFFGSPIWMTLVAGVALNISCAIPQSQWKLE